MNVSRLLRTIKYLRSIQLYFQVKNRIFRPKYVSYKAHGGEKGNLSVEPIPKLKCVEGNTFTFLNLEHDFTGWNFTENGMLWAYNQNYFDWINQEGFSEAEGCKWIDKFIDELPDNKVGLNPYPIALRTISWVKFFCKYPQTATKGRLDSLYSQIKLLDKKLEYHLLGNHLLEDAYALYIVGSFFRDKDILNKAKKLLLEQLKEQILPDGAHFEQSPMYHCVLLDRLLDCINMSTLPELVQYASRMLGHLESVIWNDQTIPLFNDSAFGIAPEPKQIFDYARRLGIKWEAIPMKECGYRKLQNSRFEAIVDVGNITATYQPGHTHADTLGFELRVDGKPVVIDTGVSTYNVTSRRQYERSTAAHNCVSVDEKDSSEVWGGFRVGKRCEVRLTADDTKKISAEHNGFNRTCMRDFQLDEKSFIVNDIVDAEAVSYIHLAPGVDEGRIKVVGADKIEVLGEKTSISYNQLIDIKVLKIFFSYTCKYIIEI